MSATHTPGPWQPIWLCGDSDKSPSEVCAGDHNHRVAFMASNGRLADALLIAAAPDLLAACKEWIALANRGGLRLTIGERHCMEVTFAAIAKATGQ